jgi:hypothetical protein
LQCFTDKSCTFTESAGCSVFHVAIFEQTLLNFVMEKENVENRSKLVVAIVLIVLGMFWFLGQLNVHIHFENIFRPFFHIFSRMGHVIFSWPMILVLVGLLLVAGKRQGGWILVVLGGIFLLPKIFIIPGFTFSMIFPVVLILAGVVMLIRKV